MRFAPFAQVKPWSGLAHLHMLVIMTHAHTHESGATPRRRPVTYTHAHEPVSPENRWWQYVCMISKDASPSEVGRVIGANQSTVHRWRSTSPSVAAVRSFAHSYDRPVLEAFVAAGFLSDEEVAGVVGEQTTEALQASTAQLRAVADRIYELARMVSGPAEEAAERATGPARRAAELLYKSTGGTEK